jgi:O-antigen ligase
LRPSRLAGTDLLAFSFGAAATSIAAYISVRVGVEIGVGLVLMSAVLVVSVIGFVFAPHALFAALIPLYALIPTMKVFLTPAIGPVKDLVAVAAIVATAALALSDRAGRFRRSTQDGWVVAAVGLLVVFYVVNPGGGHGVAWAQGVRLIGEPLLLLVCGFAVPYPRRTLRWAVVSLIVTSCLVAAYGIVQQAVGRWTLVAWGYSFNSQVRTFNGHLRSFGTLDDPFIYAAFLLFGLAACLFAVRRLALPAVLLLGAGLASAWVRTAYLVLAALVGLWIGRRGYHVSGVLVVGAAVAVAAFVLVAGTGATESTTYRSAASNLTLNGRTSAWKAAVGKPSEWPFGRGVGEVGTAAYRAGYTVAPAGSSRPSARAVDSGYLATVADVGVAGLMVLLALLGRLLQLGTNAIRRGDAAGWFAVGVLVVIILDAVTRSSFTGFPTASLGLLLVGVALAAAGEDRLPRTGGMLRVQSA